MWPVCTLFKAPAKIFTTADSTTPFYSIGGADFHWRLLFFHVFPFFVFWHTACCYFDRLHSTLLAYINLIGMFIHAKREDNCSCHLISKKNYVRTTNLHSFKDAECLLLYMPSSVSTLLNRQDSLPSSSDIQTPERRLHETPFHPEGSRQDYRSQWMSVQWIKPMRCGIHFWFAERIGQFITTEIINHQKIARFADAEWWWYHVIPCDTKQSKDMSCFAAQKNPQIVASAEKGEPQAQWSIGIGRGTVGEPRTFRAFLNSGCQGKNLGP